MNFKTTIFLLVLVLLVGAYFIFVDRKAPTTQELNENAAQQNPDAAGTTGTPLLTADRLSTEAVRSVTVEADAKKIVLKKDGTDWAQVEPVHFPLNTWSVQSLIDAAAGLRFTRKLDSTDKDRPSLEQLKLAPSQAVVTLTTGGDKPATFTIKLGRTTLGGRGYVMIDNDPAVYVVTDGLHKLLRDQQPDSWRRKTVQAPTESQVTRVSLTRNGQTVEAIKSDGNWALAPPHAGRADSKAIAGLLTGITGMYIDKFVADAPADLSTYGLDRPTITITATIPPPPPSASQPATKPGVVSAAKPTTKTLRIGSPVDLAKESYYAMWDEDAGSQGSAGAGGVVFTIPKSATEKFAKSVDDLRDPRITPLAGADVHEVTIQRGPKDVVRLLRGPAGWDFAPASGIPGDAQNPWVPAVGFKADNNEVSNLVDSIVDAKATKYEDRLTHIVSPPSTIITLTAIGKSEPDVLRAYPAEPGMFTQNYWLVVRNNETTGYLVPVDKLTAATVTALSLRDRVALDLPIDRLQRVYIECFNHPTVIFERTVPPLPTTRPAETRPSAAKTTTAPGPWKLDGQEKFETAAFDSMLHSLLPLRVDKWMDSYRWTSDVPTITFQTAEGVTKSLRIETRTRIGQIGSLPAFVVSQKIVDQISQEFRDRTVLPVPAADFKQVTVTRDGKMLTIHKNDDGKYVAGDDQNINQAAAGAVFDTLGNLRVERYLPDGFGEKTDLKIKVETQGGQTINLGFTAPSGDHGAGNMSGSLGSKWFLVSKDVMKKLDADLTAKEAEGEKREKSENEMPEAE